MGFILTKSLTLKCFEKMDEYDLKHTWNGTILIDDQDRFLGMMYDSEYDEKQLVVGKCKYTHDSEIQLHLYRFFNSKGHVWMYQFPSDFSTEEDVFGTISTFQLSSNCIGGIGDCSFYTEEYQGDYHEITSFYEEIASKIVQDKDRDKYAILHDLFGKNNGNAYSKTL